MARQGAGEQGHSTAGTRPQRKRRSPRRRRTGNSRISVIDRDGRGNAVGARVIYQGNDTKANRLWATMLDVSGVLTAQGVR